MPCTAAAPRPATAPRRWLRLASWTSLGLAILLLLPCGLALLEQHACACGMAKSACLCELTARPGAHCSRAGDGCAMRSCHPSTGEALMALLDRGLGVPEAARFAIDLGAPSPVLPTPARQPRSLAPRPLVPPPRLS